MRTTFNYKPSHHFWKRLWQRKIEDRLVQRALMFAREDKEHLALVLGEEFIKKQNEICNPCPPFISKLPIVIIIHNKVLVTAFGCDNPNYLKHRYPKYFIQNLV